MTFWKSKRRNSVGFDCHVSKDATAKTKWWYHHIDRQQWLSGSALVWSWKTEHFYAFFIVDLLHASGSELCHWFYAATSEGIHFDPWTCDRQPGHVIHFVWILLGSKHHFQLEIRHGSANGRVQSILMGCHALFPRTASYFPVLSNEGAAGAVLVQPIEALSHPPCHTGWKKHHGKHRLGGENAKLWAKTSLVANPWVQQSLGVKQVRV